MASPRRVVILGAAGRDFHNFNTVFRDSPDDVVVAFTATQIPNISGRAYPAALAGPRYPHGIPIVAEAELSALIERERVDVAVFAYSDVPHVQVMHVASQCLAAGADFLLQSAEHTMLRSSVPVIAVTAVRTGAGKSQTTRYLSTMLRAMGKRVVAIRHPMPYGDLERQACQRFADYADLDRHECTIEEREEYEPHIDTGAIVYAGVDYAQILAAAEQEADVILWDGGNNDLPFYRPDLHIVVADPLRAGDESRYHPGETNVRMADVVVVNKCDSAPPEDVVVVEEAVRRLNPERPADPRRQPRHPRQPCRGARSRCRGGGGRADAHPWLDVVGCRGRGRPRGRRRIHRRPEPVCRGLARGDVPPVPQRRGDPAGDGLRGRAGGGPRGHHRGDPL